MNKASGSVSSSGIGKYLNLSGSASSDGASSKQYDLQGPFWEGIAAANDGNNFQLLGVFFLVTFAVSWITAAGIYYGPTMKRSIKKP